MKRIVSRRMIGCALASAMVVGLMASQMSTVARAAEYETIEPGVLIVAFNGDMPGTGWSNGRLIGIDGEVMQWVADELGLKVKPALMEWSAEIASVTSRRVDIMHGMMSWRPQRAEVMLISDPIYYGQGWYVQSKDTNYNRVSDLEGKVVASIQGFGQVKELKNVDGIDLRLYDTTDAALRDLLAGRVEVFFGDPPLIAYGIQQNPDWPIHGVPAHPDPDDRYPTLSGVKYSVVFGMHKDSKNLLAAFNEKIAEAWETCKVAEIAKNYGLGQASWFDPGARNIPRQGVDKPSDWKFPQLAEKCKSLFD